MWLRAIFFHCPVPIVDTNAITHRKLLCYLFLELRRFLTSTVHTADTSAIFPCDQREGCYVVYLFRAQAVHILMSHFHQRS